MKRLALALVCCFAIPFVYTITLGLFAVYSKNWRLILLLAYPVRWPTTILFRLLPPGSFPFRRGDRTFLFLYIIICNALLYTIPIYFLLWRFSKRKRKIERFDLPPNTTQFLE